MVHLQVVSPDGTQPARMPTAHSSQDFRMHLPNLDLATYGRMMAEQSEDYVLMRRRARIDARRLVHNLRARHPMREIQGVCVWDLVGDVLCYAVPTADRLHAVELAAHGLRMMFDLMVRGGRLKAAVSMGSMVMDMDGEWDVGRFTMTMVRNEDRVRVDFVIDQGSLVLAP